MVFLLALTAHAGGYYYPDSGIVAYGQGGAFVASAEGQFAQYYNPAGLVRTEAPTVNLGLSGVQQHVTFTRLHEGELLEPSSNQGKPFLIPQIGFVTPFAEDFAFAVGFTSPFAPDYEYDRDGPQRYTIADTGILNFAVGPSLAWRPLPWLAVGAGFQWQVLRVEERLAVTTREGDDPANDVGVHAEVWDTFTPGVNAGVIVEPVEFLSIGLSVQPPSSYRGKGSGELDFTDHVFASQLDQAVYRDEEIALNLDLPLVLRSGIAVRPVEGLQVETAFVWERWSVLGDILVEDIDVTIGGGLIPPTEVDDTIALPAGFRDVFSVRLGGSYDVVDELTVRAGGFWERGALTPEKVSVALVDPSKFQAGLGLTLHPVPAAAIDLSFARLFFPDLSIRDSEVTQINVLEEEEVIVVGNGDLSSNGWMIGGQVSWAFGTP